MEGGGMEKSWNFTGCSGEGGGSRDLLGSQLGPSGSATELAGRCRLLGPCLAF